MQLFFSVPATAQSLQYNFEYKCGKETIVIGHCRKDSDRPCFPPTTPDQDYCQVYYPDRPKHNGFQAMGVELRRDLIKQLQACGALTTRESASGTKNGQTGGASNLAGTQPSSGTSPAPSGSQPTAPSGIEALVQVLGNLINQSLTQVSSTPGGTAQNTQAAQLATVESKQGEAFLKAKDYNRAVEHFNKSIGLAPSSAAYTGLGSSYYSLKQYPQAIEAFKKTIRMAPNVAEAHFWLAMAYQQHGNQLVTGTGSRDLKPFQDAESEAREALRLKPDYHDAYFALGVATSTQGKYPEALMALQQAIRLQPDDQASLYMLGLTYARQGKKDEAMGVYRKLAALNKDYAQKLLTEINKPVAANPPASAAPDTAGFYINEGHKYFKAKDGVKALEAYQQAVRLKPDDPGGSFLGWRDLYEIGPAREGCSGIPRISPPQAE